MQAPYLTEIRTGRAVIDAFGGYDHRAVIAENSFYNMENLCGEAYPALTPRAPRGKRKLPLGCGKATALLSGFALSYVANGRLYVHDRPVMRLNDEGPKKLIAMGAYIIVLPDKVYYNTADPNDSGRMEAETASTGTVSLTICDGEGKPFDGTITESATAPANPENMALWLDISDAKTPALKQYTTTTGVWTSVLSTTVRIYAQGIGAGFKAGDGVRINGIPAGAAPLNDYNGKDVILTAAEENAVAIVGIMAAATATDTATLTLSRKLPVMDHVFECQNRLWGCRYGSDADGSFVNEIYCSALGDFKNWRQYNGISTDSYAASVGAEGAWTGGIAYQNMPHFFKDNKLFRVYGSYPAAYRIDELTCRGVQAGAEKSLVILNERLLYKSRGGVCVYDGAYPTDISEPLGDVKYIGTPAADEPAAAAGAWDNKYYISMLSESDNRYHLFVYDMRLGLWYRENDTHAVQFAVEDGRLVFIDADGDVQTVTGGTGGAGRVAWMAETGPIGMCVPGASNKYNVSASAYKYISRVTLRAALELGSSLTVEIQYDSTEPWIHIATVNAINMRSFSLPIRPRRCDHFRLRLKGKGGMKLFSLTKTVEEGSDA